MLEPIRSVRRSHSGLSSLSRLSKPQRVAAKARTIRRTRKMRNIAMMVFLSVLIAHDAHPSFTDRIAWVALLHRLGTKDVEAFSGWMLTSAGKFALAKRYCRPTACAGRLQLR